MKSRSLTETKAIARRIAGRLRGEACATVLALTGELGAGKTVFTQALLKALGAKEKVVSPTFVLIREYPLRTAEFKKAYHADLYRLGKRELGPLHLAELFAEPKTLIIIEWAERARRDLPKRTTWIHFAHGKTSKERTIRILAP
jgi:tRNA threonylcarbamoyladenosine biosynthesis protein TsaE